MIAKTNQLVTELLTADDKPVFLLVDGEKKHVDSVMTVNGETLIVANGDVVIDEGR